MGKLPAAGTVNNAKNHRLGDFVLWFFLAIIFGIMLFNLFSDNLNIIQRYIGDDAFFYLVIARNFSRGIISSFDGLHYTNGYHPLWMVLSAGIARLISDDDAYLRISILTGFLFEGCMLYLLWSFFRHRARDRTTAYLVMLTAVIFLVLPSWHSLESPLAVLITLAALGFLIKHRDDDSLKHSLLLGLFLSLAVLARLDSIFVVAPLLLARLYYLSRDKKRTFRSFSLTLLVFSLPLAAYLALNLAMTGHLVPISGAIKSSFPVPTLTNLSLSVPRLARIAPPVFSALLVTSLLLLERKGKRISSPLPTLFLGLNLGVILFSIYEFFFQKDAGFGLRPWHFAVPNLIMVLSLGLFVYPRFPRLLKYALAGLIITAGLTNAAAKYGFRNLRDVALYDVYHTALWVRGNVAETEVIAATDPGIVAYFGRCRTINLDGLVNTYRYQEMVAAGRLEEYLRENKVRYLAIMERNYRPAADGKVRIKARLYGKYDTLDLTQLRPVYSSPHRYYRIYQM
ncbi:MAG: glycosyltransferase family 39 protein [Candidatus Krumholzibacteriota bacterium]|nr:glycosyltransferase family 39 protein [Candidatus Krumholzibacteriota bacterium]